MIEWHRPGIHQVCLPLIVKSQLLLSNAILHNEKVSEIRVFVDIIDNAIQISVSNDGVVTPSSEWNSGRGISNLRVRSRDMHGKLSIDDLEDGWVSLTWSIPLSVNN